MRYKVEHEVVLVPYHVDVENKGRPLGEKEDKQDAPVGYMRLVRGAHFYTSSGDAHEKEDFYSFSQDAAKRLLSFGAVSEAPLKKGK